MAKGAVVTQDQKDTKRSKESNDYHDIISRLSELALGIAGERELVNVSGELRRLPG